jgi:catechol 2,3-dioxygenase-like lactoylglutathione lyase family enzyme
VAWAVERTFLRIDHKAILVGDTETSLRFYRDLLGMRIAGESENRPRSTLTTSSEPGCASHLCELPQDQALSCSKTWQPPC